MAAALLLVGTGFVRAATAQTSTEAAPAHVTSVDGAATLERDGQLEPLEPNTPIVAGDRVHTSSGRVEILFPDGTALAIDHDTALDILAPTLLRLGPGRALLVVAGAADPAGALRYQIDTPVASIDTGGPGEFRVSVLREDETELAVIRGYARLISDRGEIDLRAGEQSVAFDGSAPSRPQIFNSARFDPFDRWASDRQRDRVTGRSAQYLPRELRVYGSDFDRYGSWEAEGSYGYVWYPSVASDWRPYYSGYWDDVPSYGWTWIGTDRWSWPTHHYGRWGYARDRWFWIPGRTWGPAWVSWAGAADYVSWCPLGFDGRPVFALSFESGRAFSGWTILPRTSFGSRGRFVNREAVAPQRLPRSTRFDPQAPPVSLARARRGNALPAAGAATRRFTPPDPARRPPSSDTARRPGGGEDPAVKRGPGAGVRRPDGSRGGRFDSGEGSRRRPADGNAAAETRREGQPVERGVPRDRGAAAAQTPAAPSTPIAVRPPVYRRTADPAASTGAGVPAASAGVPAPGGAPTTPPAGTTPPAERRRLPEPPPPTPGVPAPPPAAERGNKPHDGGEGRGASGRQEQAQPRREGSGEHARGGERRR